MRIRAGLPAIALLGLVLAGCGSAGGEGRDDPDTIVDPVDVQLAGQTFVSTSVTGYTLQPGTQIRLSFEGDVLAAIAGCNTMAATWNDDDGELAWDGPAASTMMACEPGLEEQDQWLAGLLTDGMTIADGDADLTLESGDVTIELDAEDQPDDPTLLGKTWTVVGVIEDGESARLPQSVDNPTLTVAEDGTVAVDTGCNTGHTTVTIDADASTMEFTPMGMTMMACSPLVSSIEQSVVAVLDGTVTMKTDGSVLVLTSGDQGLILDVQ